MCILFYLLWCLPHYCRKLITLLRVRGWIRMWPETMFAFIIRETVILPHSNLIILLLRANLYVLSCGTTVGIFQRLICDILRPVKQTNTTEISDLLHQLEYIDSNWEHFFIAEWGLHFLTFFYLRYDNGHIIKTTSYVTIRELNIIPRDSGRSVTI